MTYNLIFTNSHTSYMYILYDMMLIRSKPVKVGHDPDLKIMF